MFQVICTENGHVVREFATYDAALTACAALHIYNGVRYHIKPV